MEKDTVLDQLLAEIKALEATLEDKKAQADVIMAGRREGIVSEMRETIRAYDIDASELGLSAAKRGRPTSRVGRVAKVVSVAKYRSPKGEAWSGGRGRKPKWVVSHLAVGGNIEDFAI